MTTQTQNIPPADAIGPEPDAPPREPPAQSEPRKSLRHHLFRGSVWTFVGFGAGNILRLGSTLVLTRLLNQEIYGEMVILYVVMYGLAMFSDIGSGPAIIRDKRGDDPVFLNTAWTIQVVRGFLLWIVGSALALPLGLFYNRPDLYVLLPAMSFTAAIAGFNSTKMFTCERHLALGRLVIVELGQHIAAIIVMIALAITWKSPWVFVFGAIAQNILRSILSHLALPGVPNRFMFNREAYLQLFHFGKWIFMGSALFFIAKQSDRILMTKYVAETTLGIYGIAVQLADTGISLVIQLARGVLLPGLGRVHRENEERVAQAFYRARLRINAVFLPAAGMVITAGNVPIELLFSKGWWQAGWMLQLLGIQAATRILFEPCEQCVVALGHTRYVFITHLTRAAWIVCAIPLGWHFCGVMGVILAVATSEVTVGAILYWALWRHRVLRPMQEVYSLLLIAAGMLAGLGIEWLWQRYGLDFREQLHDFFRGLVARWR
ncbi:MAG: oligosaccharide flippase family protein [Phycisphaeraceae bacterium]|nr:oligosaccharide flippase family protein [Phycisphaeraceae bacterium]